MHLHTAYGLHQGMHINKADYLLHQCMYITSKELAAVGCVRYLRVHLSYDLLFTDDIIRLAHVSRTFHIR